MSTISEKLTRLAGYKQDIKNAIIGKGQTVDDDMSKFADAISKISGGGGDLPEILDTDPLTFVRIDNSILNGGVSIINNGVTNTKTFEYNKNDTGWTAYTIGEEISMNYADKLQFRSNSTTSMSTSTTIYRSFKTRGTYNCGGNLASLMNNNTTMTLSTYGFCYLFRYCNIINAPILPWTKLNNYCYYGTFQNCTNLVTAPELPATTLVNSCYSYLFQNCTSLVNAPELPATTLATYCYNYMFYGCASLVNAPEILPATTLATYCYNYMFTGCFSLVTAPELPATTLASDCYTHMFEGCKKINTIKAKCMYKSEATLITTSIGSSWLNGASSTGTFYKNPDWTGPTSRTTSTIPSGWAIRNWTE